LPPQSNIVKLLQRLRDESHRFALSYHSVLRQKRQTASPLDILPGIGPATKKKLLGKYGSLKAIEQASIDELGPIIGQKKAQTILSYYTESDSK